MRFAGDVGAALHEHGGVGAADAQVGGAGHTGGHADVGAGLVKGEAGAEQVAEIQREAARQRLQAEHAQQLGRAGVGFEKLALAHVQPQVAAQAGVVGGGGRAAPVQLAGDLAFAAAQGVGHAQAREQMACVGRLEREVQPGAARTPFGGGGPGAVGVQGGVGVLQAQGVELPLAFGGVSGCVMDGADVQLAQVFAVQAHVLHADVERGHAREGLGGRFAAGGFFGFVGFFGAGRGRFFWRRCIRLGPVQALQPGAQQARVLALRGAVFDLACQFVGMDFGAPAAALAGGVGLHGVQGAAADEELARAQVRAVGHVAAGGAGGGGRLGVAGAGEDGVQRVLPFGGGQGVQRGMGGHAAGGQGGGAGGMHAGLAQRQCAAQHAAALAGALLLIFGAKAFARTDGQALQAAGQGAPFVEQGPDIGGGLVQRGGQLE